MSRKFNAKFEDLKGYNLRNMIIDGSKGADNVRQSYHNKHKDKSGNFGIVIRFELGGKIDAGCGMMVDNDAVYELHGDYASDKTLYNLCFGTVSRPITPIPEGLNYAQIVEYMNTWISTNGHKSANWTAF